MRAAEPDPTRSDTLKPTIAGLLAIVFWSTTVAFSRSLTEKLGVFTAGAITYLAAGAIGCGWLAAGNRLLPLLRGADRRYLVGCGAMMAAYTVLLYAAIGLAPTRGEVVAATVANYLWPGLTLLFSVPLLGFKARFPLLVSGTVIGIGGVVLTAIPDASEFGRDGISAPCAIAAGLGGAAAVCWALYSNLSRRWAARDPGGGMAIFILATGLLLLVLSAVRDERSTWSAAGLLEASYMILFPTLLAYTLWDAAARRGDLPLVAAASYLTPLLSLLVSAWYLGVDIAALQMLGGALVIAGAALSKAAIIPPGGR